MPVVVELFATGDAYSPGDVRAEIEHVFADRPGDWRVSLVGSKANDRCDMKITGSQDFERSYTLEGSVGEHRPEVIRQRLVRMLPRKMVW